MKAFYVEATVASKKLAVKTSGELTKLLVRDNSTKSLVGGIYKGRVKRVMNAMRSCFVDIGETKPGYLSLKEGSPVKASDEILVQVKKDIDKDKGPRLDTEISISGKYLVYIPENDRIVFSKKITDPENKRAIRELFKRLDVDKGFIVRTEAADVDIDELREEIDSLRDRYISIKRAFNRGSGVGELYSIDDTINKYIDEHFEIGRDILYTNDESLISHLRYEFIKRKIDPSEHIIREGVDLFETNGISAIINKYLGGVIELPSGGSVVVEKTEAMTVIDVNTKAFVGDLSFEDTVFRNNLEAAEEIVRQIVLRDISGIIIVDFIDMKKKNHRKEILKRLEDGFRLLDDKKVDISGFTRLGLVEISRRRGSYPVDEYFLSDKSYDKELEASPLYMADLIEKEIYGYITHRNVSSLSIVIDGELKNDERFVEVMEEIRERYSDMIDIEVKYDESEPRKKYDINAKKD